MSGDRQTIFSDRTRVELLFFFASRKEKEAKPTKIIVTHNKLNQFNL